MVSWSEHLEGDIRPPRWLAPFCTLAAAVLSVPLLF